MVVQTCLSVGKVGENLFNHWGSFVKFVQAFLNIWMVEQSHFIASSPGLEISGKGPGSVSTHFVNRYFSQCWGPDQIAEWNHEEHDPITCSRGQKCQLCNMVEQLVMASSMASNEFTGNRWTIAIGDCCLPVRVIETNYPMLGLAWDPLTEDDLSEFVYHIRTG